MLWVPLGASPLLLIAVSHPLPSVPSFPSLITVPLLFRLAMNNSIMFKFSADVCSVSFIYHLVLASVTWMWLCVCWPVALRLASRAGFRRCRVSWHQQEWLPRDAAKLQITVPWKQSCPARGKNSLFWEDWNPRRFPPFSLSFFTRLETLFSNAPPNAHSPFLLWTYK